MLEEAGLLAALYTDSSAFSNAGRIARHMVKLGINNNKIRALASRKPEGISQEQCFSSDRLLFESIFPKVIKDNLYPVYKKWGIGNIDILYSMYGEDFQFLEYAKNNGVRIAVDVFCHPETNAILAEERKKYGYKLDACRSIAAENDRSKQVFDIADILLCPSIWVADGVRKFSPKNSDKIRIIPYGSSIVRQQSSREPVKGRVLFAGRDPLGKGVHYLAEAAKALRVRGYDLDVRLAGLSEKDISWIEDKTELNCLGNIPVDQMQKEYSEAELFVLPSLSEGQAGVLLEALACGCPVVTTKESGVDFGKNAGIIVQVKNSEALATAIGKILSNPSLRSDYSRGALQAAQYFSIDLWRKRLEAVMMELFEL